MDNPHVFFFFLKGFNIFEYGHCCQEENYSLDNSCQEEDSFQDQSNDDDDDHDDDDENVCTIFRS